MKNYLRELRAVQAFFFIVIAFLYCNKNSMAQSNAAINYTGTSANPYAILDLDIATGASKGLLVPRMTNTERTAMTFTVAAQGLTVYQTDGTQGFYYNTSATTTPNWVRLGNTPLNLTTDVTDVLPIANGGTASSLANTGFNNLAPSQTSNSGKFLTTNGTNTSWSTVSLGTSTSGKLPTTQGGTNTNIATVTVGDILVGDGSNSFQLLPDVAAGQILTSGGVGVIPSYSSTLPTGVDGLYFKLLGRSGGQTANGGTAAGENLTLHSTAHATKGKIVFGTSAYDEVNNRLGIANSTPSNALSVTGAADISTTLSVGTFAKVGSTAGFGSGVLIVKETMLGGGSGQTIDVIGQPDDMSESITGLQVTARGEDGTNAITGTTGISVTARHQTTQSGNVLVGASVGWLSANGASGTLATAKGLVITQPTGIGASTGAVPATGTGIEIQDQGRTGIGTTYALKINSQSLSTTLWGLADDASQSYHGGSLRIGSTSAPAEKLDVTGNVRFSGALMPNGTAGTSGYILTSAGAGSVPTWADPAGLGVRWNAITAPTGNLSLAHGSSTTSFSFNSLVNNSTAFDLTSTSTAGASGTSKVLNISRSGANTSSGHTAYGQYSSVTNTGTSSTNVAAYFTASGGTNNYAALFDQGNVGIGTTSPSVRFDVVESGGGADCLHAAAIGGNAITGSTSAGGVGVLGTSTSSGTGGTFSSSSGYALLTTGGNVGFGTSAPTALLSVNGTANKPGGGSWAVFSDEKLKQNVQPFNDGLTKLLQINPVTFQYNGKAGITGNESYVGVVAQQMQQILPYTVSEVQTRMNPGDVSTESVLVFDPNALTYILVNSIKELNVENTTLKNELLNLKARITALENE